MPRKSKAQKTKEFMEGMQPLFDEVHAMNEELKPIFAAMDAAKKKEPNGKRKDCIC